MKVNFTRQWVDKVDLPATGHVEYQDTKTDGLRLRVTASGVKSFFVYRWARLDNGSKGPKRVQLGRYDHNAKAPAGFDKNPLCVLGNNPMLNIDHARYLAIAVIGKLNGGENPADAERTISAELTLGELFEEYMTRHMSKKKTADDTRKIFERDLICWTKHKLSKISPAMCDELHGRYGREKGEFTANRRIQLLKAMFNCARKWKLFAGDNPCNGVTLFEEKPRHRFLSPEEAARLLTALKDDKNADIRDFVLISMFTGARKANVLSCRWDDFNFSNGTWIIPDTKNGDSQVVTLTNTEISLLSARKQRLKDEGGKQADSQWVFPSTGRTGHLADPKKQWNRIRELANLDDVHLHDLRRSLAATMASANVNTALIKSALNHRDIKTTLAVYARTAKEAERSARETAHEVWLKEAGLLPKEAKVVPFRKAK